MEEEFISIDNWLPGTTTDKKIKVTNSGNVDEAVRISYTETWTSKDGTELPLMQGDNRAAIINFSDNDDWQKVVEDEKEYYYYNYKLAPNETTSILIDSVTFNKDITSETICTLSNGNDNKSVVCTSTGKGYDGATYKLKFKIETVQFDKYKEIWGTEVAILNSRTIYCDPFEVGESVTYNGAEYYVFKNSSPTDQYVTLLKKDHLTSEEVNVYSTTYVSEDGEYPYYESDNCNANDESGCSTNCDISDVKKIVDGWSSQFSEDLIEVDGYKARLIGSNDFSIGIGDSYGRMYMYSDIPRQILQVQAFVPFQVQYIVPFWSNVNIDDSNVDIIIINDELINAKVYSKSLIKPIINLNKNALEGVCSSSKKKQYLNCTKGETLKYNDEDYYILKNSDVNKKSVTVLKADPLTAEEVNKYSTNYVSEDGRYPFCAEGSEDCDYYGNYEDTGIKKIVDGWSNNFIDDLTEIYGHKAGLLNYHDYWNDPIIPKIYFGKEYWAEDHDGVSYDIHGMQRYSKLYIRPYMNLNKEAIQEGCGLGSEYRAYNIGENITYNNTNYCVISYSGINQEYVTLIKQDPLTYDELVMYNNGYEISRDSIDNTVGNINYYNIKVMIVIIIWNLIKLNLAVFGIIIILL